MASSPLLINNYRISAGEILSYIRLDPVDLHQPLRINLLIFQKGLSRMSQIHLSIDSDIATLILDNPAS
jgi:hypothetical protein